MFNFNEIVKDLDKISSKSYEDRIEFLKKTGRETLHIESTVEASMDNLSRSKRSFVIYGEPQSGKTEMMIALTAKLLDSGYRTIIILMNDNVTLLNQNLTRFKKSGLSTTPVGYKELIDKSVDITSRPRVIFSKKNASDLKKLCELTRKVENVVVIDDEADYATPNSKINKNEISTINKLTSNLLDSGVYIGVTATPARLNLNNTHLNDAESWIDYPKHSNYTGQDVFFPTNIAETQRFTLTLLPDESDNPKYLREALFNFLVNSAYLNLVKARKGYTMLVHTSGNKADHDKDFKDLNNVIKDLTDKDSKKRESFYEQIWNIASKKFDIEANDIVRFILSQIESIHTVVMNSDHENGGDITENPPSPFTIIVGGNSISRGVTFNNLLSMYFTRDSKHSIQQDTYIQRARMFGSREDILKYFELSIPKKLYADWRRAFIFHRLSLESRKNGAGIPIWHEGMRIKVASNSSIDSSRVTFDRGEMSFSKFKVGEDVLDIFNSSYTDISKLSKLKQKLGEKEFPGYLSNFINAFSGLDEKSVVVHHPRSVVNMDEKYTDYDDISRSRGLIAGKDLKSVEKPEASHHIFIFTNSEGYARIVYKFNENISFIKGQV